MKLYQISDRIEEILATQVDRETGEMNEDTLNALIELDEVLESKALAVAAYMKGELCEAEAVKAESAKLAKRAKGHEARAEWLRRYLEIHVPDGTTFKDARSIVKWVGKPPSVQVVDESLIPKRYLAVVPRSTKPDKKAIAARLKNGKPVNGCLLIKGKRLEVK